MNEGVLELPLLLLEESAGVAAMAAIAALTAVSAAWRRLATRFAALSAPTLWVKDLGRQSIAIHDQFYAYLAGVHPHRRIWHFQWLSVKDLYRDLSDRLPAVKGRVADIGCLGKPYAVWLTGADLHYGIDVRPGRDVDLVIHEDEAWALESGSFDFAICIQVLQVAQNPKHLISELERILAPSGTAIVCAPFEYHDMSQVVGAAVYRDYWRFSVQGLQHVLGEKFEVVTCRRQGGFGSVGGAMLLNWIRASMTERMERHLLLVALLPLWLLFSVFVNVAGWLLDKIDTTGVFYHNAMIVVRKKAVVLPAS
jgi:SAM-dependent methyltransferase